MTPSSTVRPGTFVEPSPGGGHGGALWRKYRCVAWHPIAIAIDVTTCFFHIDTHTLLPTPLRGAVDTGFGSEICNSTRCKRRVEEPLPGTP
jgi:hypothetical protein